MSFDGKPFFASHELVFLMLPVFVVVPLPKSKREQATREISETREKAQFFRVLRLFRVLRVLPSHSSPQNPLVPVVFSLQFSLRSQILRFPSQKRDDGTKGNN
jgi:hypothetical protein